MEEHSQFSRTPQMAESDSIPATATFTAPRAGIRARADDGGSLGSSPSWWGEFAGVRQPVSYHLGCPLVILHSSNQLAECELGIGRA